MCVTTKQFDKALGPDARILRLAAIVRRPKPLFWKPKIQEKPYGIGGADLVSMDYGSCKTFTKCHLRTDCTYTHWVAKNNR
jgi:hypothetical protein